MRVTWVRTKKKALMRTKVWFGGMDDMVERAVRFCRACQLEGRDEGQDVIKSSELPDKAWDQLAMDFFELPSEKN